MTVTRSGLIPARRSARPIGSVTLDTDDRARELSIEFRPVGLAVVFRGESVAGAKGRPRSENPTIAA
jgi:hypothetical protein